MLELKCIWMEKLEWNCTFAIINHAHWLYTREQTNSSNKFAANLNMKGISFFLSTLYAMSCYKAAYL